MYRLRITGNRHPSHDFCGSDAYPRDALQMFAWNLTTFLTSEGHDPLGM